MIEVNPLWGVVEVGVLILMALLGVHLAIAMGVTGLIFAVVYYSSLKSVTMAGVLGWSTAFSYSITLLPLFVMMGEVISKCGFGVTAFDCFYKIFSKLRGGLAIVATLSCALFGTIVGSNVAAICTIGGAAVPAMKAKGYSVSLRTGSIAVAGILANMIPPSNAAIVYCMLNEVSVGKVFIALVIPGVILTFLFCLTVFIWVSLKPEIAPLAKETYSLREKVVSLKGIVPIAVVVIAILGGIYFGIMSTTEAAGVGAIYAVVLGLVTRALNRERFVASMMSTVKTTAMVMLIIMAAVFFSQTISVSGLPKLISDWLLALDLPGTVIIFGIIFVIIIVGFPLEVMAIQVMFIPLFLPTVVKLGYDPIWYGALTVLLLEISVLTPPIATNLYIAQSLDPEATLGDVTRGTLPYYAAAIALLSLLVFFPQIATWLPSQM